MASHKFRGNDRRLLTKAEKVLQAMLKRDQKATSTKRTRAISTRSLMLDSQVSPIGPLTDAVNHLIVQFGTLLSQ